MLRLYDSRLSGNAWKVRILLTQLGIPFERVTLDLAKGAAAEPAFRAKSRFARVPVLELEDGRTIVESVAIMLYLAEGSPLLPNDSYLRAEVTSWLTFEQADLLRALALPRFYNMRGVADQMKSRIADFQEGAYVALAKLDAWLATHDGWSTIAIPSPTSACSAMWPWRRRVATIWKDFRRSARGWRGSRPSPAGFPWWMRVEHEHSRAPRQRSQG
jgi:glutathione S-transferase